jgi:hypothetical protein
MDGGVGEVTADYKERIKNLDSEVERLRLIITSILGTYGPLTVQRTTLYSINPKRLPLIWVEEAFHNGTITYRLGPLRGESKESLPS